MKNKLSEIELEWWEKEFALQRDLKRIWSNVTLPPPPPFIANVLAMQEESAPPAVTPESPPVIAGEPTQPTPEPEQGEAKASPPGHLWLYLGGGILLGLCVTLILLRKKSA